MHNTTINAIRDLAIRYEKSNPQVALELMQLAYRERPSGTVIRKKYFQYKEDLKPKTDAQLEISRLVDIGELAIIPMGFRCATSNLIRRKLRLSQESLPFDNGFFPPDAIASVLENPKIDMRFLDNGETHAVCIKDEFMTDPELGVGIEFTTTTYKEIDSIATHRGAKQLNRFLDSTLGYYTLNKEHKFVLAHYNWHPLSHNIKSNRVTNPNNNINSINDMLNRRIHRMFDRCRKATHVCFIYGENQGFRYMRIDERTFLLDDFSRLREVGKQKFGQNFFIADIGSLDSASELLKRIG